MESSLIHSLHNLHTLDSTLDEEDSFIFLKEYNIQKSLYHRYEYPNLNRELIDTYVSNFCFFYAKIRDLETDRLYSSTIPLNIFRFVLLADGNFSPYYTVRRKSGYIVEGLHWSNGLVYQVREDKKEEFQTYQIVLVIDSLTKTMYNYL
jgi:hypothetical protein